MLVRGKIVGQSPATSRRRENVRCPIFLVRSAFDGISLTFLFRFSLAGKSLQFLKAAHFLLRLEDLALHFVNSGKEKMDRWLCRTILLGHEQIGQRITLLRSEEHTSEL